MGLFDHAQMQQEPATVLCHPVDLITQCQAQRGILEFSYKYPGRYMFHAHKTEFAELGWTGIFEVKE